MESKKSKYLADLIGYRT